MSSYPNVPTWEWFKISSPYRQACCACGNVHEIDFKVDVLAGMTPIELGVNAGISLRVRTDDEATAMIRAENAAEKAEGDEEASAFARSRRRRV